MMLNIFLINAFFCHIITLSISLNTQIPTVTCYTENSYIIFTQNVQTDSGWHTNVGSFPGVKWIGA